MEASAQTYQHFYTNLGRLFYAFAAADKSVMDEEVEALRRIVGDTWMPFEDTHDDYGSDAAHQIEFQFEVLHESAPNANDCFNEFKTYYGEHPELFTKEVKHLIWNTADGIVSSFSGKNKSELVMLDQLRVLLEG